MISVLDRVRGMVGQTVEVGFTGSDYFVLEYLEDVCGDGLVLGEKGDMVVPFHAIAYVSLSLLHRSSSNADEIEKGVVRANEDLVR